MLSYPMSLILGSKQETEAWGITMPTHPVSRYVVVELWPSLSEIRLDEQTQNLYLAGLEGFYQSLGALERDLRKSDIPFEWYEYIGYHAGQFIAGLSLPPTIAAFVIPVVTWLGTPGVAGAVSTILEVWVSNVLGRKFKVKIGGVDAEAKELTCGELQDSFGAVIKPHGQQRELQERHALFHKFEQTRIEMMQRAQQRKPF